MLLAHVKLDENEEWDTHNLKDHLEGVATIAGEFASLIGLKKIANLVGFTHDFGKASNDFQNKLKGQSGYDPEAHVNKNVDHSTAGAQFIIEKYGEPIGSILAYTIVGHHGGLPNGFDESLSCLRERLKKDIKPYKDKLPDIDLPPTLQQSDFRPTKMVEGTTLQLSMLIRMLYSCLVDADFIDTENFMSPELSKSREREADSLAVLKMKLDSYTSTFIATTHINKKRAKILEWCREKAEDKPGLFSLTVPTGGGKTISSMAFALDHAVKYNLCRVIYVIPYTSIITQNAEVFRDVFGEKNVLEHHSNLDPKYETGLNRLSSQNWDAPIVVTTNVQFFESFYGNKSSACRKLHNVADSVIIFDEAQMFPTKYLKPSLSIINQLVNTYGCSAVLCTATQPTLSDKDLLKKDALTNVSEIISNPQMLYDDFKRVKVTLLDGKQTHKDIASKMAEYEQVLTIVNTRKEARQIMESLDEIILDDTPCYHLSTMMCPEHRNDILKTVRKQLENKLPCRVVSTQLIEAGVDVDFPVVYRAIAGLDSIAQAAGRCNRNGLQESGDVFVFNGETKPPVGHLRQSAESGDTALQKHCNDPLSLDAISDYFQDFYSKRSYSSHADVNGLDEKGIIRMVQSKPSQIPFKDIAKFFRIIEEQTFSIIVPYGSKGKKLIKDLQKWSDTLNFGKSNDLFLPRELQKRAQRFSVQLRKRAFQELGNARVLDDIFGDGQYQILINNDIYRESVGLTPDTPEFINADSLIY